MGIYFDEPKYPVIDKAPGIWKTVGNFNWKDYATIAGFTALSYPVGYVSGTKSKLSGPSAITASLLGLTAGYLYAYQSSSGQDTPLPRGNKIAGPISIETVLSSADRCAGRLMGMFPNDKEVEAGLGKQ